MNKRMNIGILLIAIFFLSTPVIGQTLILTNGTVLEGKFIGGTQESIIMEVAGETKVYALSEVESLFFGADTEPAESATMQATTVIIPAGTRILVALDQDMVTGRVSSGAHFTATLQANIMAGQHVVVSKGARFYGKVVEAHRAGRVVGIASLQLTLTDVEIDSQLHPVLTDIFGLKGSRSGTLGKIAAGMAIGAIADGRSGVDDGAAIGAAAAVLTPGRQIQIPTGALIEFRTLYERTVIINR